MSNEKTFVFKVEMTCEGCAKAIANVLNKHKDQGISKFDVNPEKKLVTIQSIMSASALLDILNKTGKKIELVEERK